MAPQTNIPQTMKAWVAFGSGRLRDVLQLKTDWPTPAPPKAGEILVKVSYVAINPGDPKMIAHSIPFRKVAIAGMDFVGEVVQVGQLSPTSATGIRTGMIVAGTVPMTSILRGVGSLAEYLVVPAHIVVEKPNGVEECVAAGLFGIVGQTSIVMLRTANLREGDRVLLNGASGGVGCILTQMLHGIGVHVTGICSSRNMDLVRRLGAEEVVDYTAHDDLYGHLTSLATSTGCRPFDAIFDCVGNDTLYYRSPGYLKIDGKYHSIVHGPLGFIAEFKFNHWPVLLGGIPRTYSSVFSNPSGSSALEVVNWFEKGCIKEVPIDSVFEIDDALKAFEALASQRTVGKIVIRVKQEAREHVA
ncbi:zinc alcohol dehydrogenase [Xylaria bambusicola]|uniref:zinc alcohol dehydrogenase n=1 Tax=Xylaria bambusicola TaxID=326684 RepID=UPI0020076220|nr:zinc alcohol dehydrogenase [Xylaria bambusicola]KAI0518058.1 zinc alcohol dehydrogenase [Xylaria bambusicola]